MARLCEEMNPIFSENALEKLRLRGICTTVDFLEENPEKLAQISKLPYKDVLQVRHNIVANFSAFPKDGKTAYRERTANSAVIPTTIQSLDSLLGGGFLTGNLYEICGASGSCKTQLCLTIAMNISLCHKQKVTYIDTKRDFSSCRIFSMLEEKKMTDNDIKKALEIITVIRVKNVFQLFTFFQTLQESLSQRESESSLVRMIIIDSLPAVFFSLLSDENNEGIALQSELASTLKHIAREYNISFLLVNLASRYFDDTELQTDQDLNKSDHDLSTSSVETETLRPALGKQWLHMPSTRLLLQKVNSEVHVSVIKSTSVKLGSSCVLSIKNEGIV